MHPCLDFSAACYPACAKTQSGAAWEVMDNWSSYRLPSPRLRDMGLACLGAGEQSGQLPSFSGRTLSTNGMVIVSEGSGTFDVRGKVFEVNAPSVLWLFPGVSHGYGPGPSGWKEHWILFTGPTARAFEEMGCFAREHPVVQFDTASWPELRATLGLFPALRAAMSGTGPRGELEASVLTQRVLVDSRKHHKKNPAAPNTPHERLLAVLRDSAYEPLRLSDLAATLKVSDAELRRSVQAATGLGPKEFVLQLRLSRAQSLLADTDLPVQRISTLTGYGDPAYFSRLFAKKTGYSPSRFRQEHRRE